MTTSETKLLSQLQRNPPATLDGIEAVESSFNVQFPRAYVDLLRYTNGASGFLEHSYIELWPAERLKELNDTYHVGEFVNDIVLIGSDGGGCALGIDFSDVPPSFVNIPFVVMCRQDMLRLGPRVSDLLLIFPTK